MICAGSKLSVHKKWLNAQLMEPIAIDELTSWSRYDRGEMGMVGALR
jgi:hypothetical protein